jgi:uncharacterized protein with PIN domain
MGKIEKAFENLYRESLVLINARKIEKGLQILLERPQVLKMLEDPSYTNALLQNYFHLRDCVRKYQKLVNGNTTELSDQNSVKFVCDSGLGGLTRWLWAAGYEAVWNPNFDDDYLLDLTIKTSSVLLTTDSMLFERRLLRDKVVRALWLPPTIKPKIQLFIVFDYFNLKVNEPRCMKCGGILEEVQKESVADKIPPRTLKWLNEYYICLNCGNLFWHGTHWKRIRPVIEELKSRGH